MPFLITVYRTGRDSGTLAYDGDKEHNLVTPCWFDAKVRPAAKNYPTCSATMMAARKWPAILLEDPPRLKGIFIHQGNDPSWSEGCIVIPKPVLLRIWHDIQPKDAHNVSVTVVEGPFVPLKGHGQPTAVGARG